MANFPTTLVEPAAQRPGSPFAPPNSPGGSSRHGQTDRVSPRFPNVSMVVPDNEAMRVAQMRQLFRAAKAKRSGLTQKWKRNRRMLVNRYWVSGRPAWMPTPQVPEIWPIIDSIVGWQTDQKIKYVISPAALPNSATTPFFLKLSGDLSAVMDSTFHVNCEQEEIAKMLFDSQVYGIGYLKTYWDQRLAGGLGDSYTGRLDPNSIYVDPFANSFDDANYIFEAREVSAQTLDRQFPGSRHLFQGGGGWVEQVDRALTQLDSTMTGGEQRANPGAISPSNRPPGGRPGQGVQSGGGYNLEDTPITLFECWVRDHKVYKGAVGEDRVMDAWRLIVIAGNRILLDVPASDISDHGLHPYSRFCPNDIGEFYGLSMVEMLIPTQESINRILAAMQHNIELAGNPSLVETEGGNTQRSNWTNRPGERRTYTNPQAPPKWMDPPTLYPAMPELLRYMLQRMEAVSGLSAVTKGGAPGGRNASSVIDAMQEAAFVRIRRQMRSLETTLRDSGYKKATLIVQNYTEPRLLAIVGKDTGPSFQYLKARHFHIPSTQGDVPLKFQLLIDAGSGRHTSRKMREEENIMLFRLGAIDERALLEALEYPNYELVAQRVQQLKAVGALQPPGQRADR